MDNAILYDLANETGRRCAVLPPDFSQKMMRRIRRKFNIKVDADAIANLINNYVVIYGFAAASLKECLLPSKDGYARMENIEQAKYMDKIVKQFLAEDIEILKNIAGWVIYYEYLR